MTKEKEERTEEGRVSNWGPVIETIQFPWNFKTETLTATQLKENTINSPYSTVHPTV